MKDTKKKDLTTGPLLLQIMLFALPLTASGILQQLFNSCDIAVVGQFVGPEALAAVGSTAPLINLILNVFMGLSIGANVVVATLEGKKQPESISRAVHTIIFLSIICGLILTALGMVMARRVLVLIETPDEVLVLADVYLKIYFAGFPFILLYNFGASVLRAKGDSFRPSVFLIAAGILNVILNLVFVLCLGLGAAGVGIATTVSNAFSAVCILVALAKEKDHYRFSPRLLAIDREHCSRIFRIGMPAGIQGMVFSLSNIVIQGALNTLGPKAMAGSASAVTFEIFNYFIVSAFSQSAVTFTSQNYGAQNFDRCRKTFFYCMGLGSGICILCSVVFTLFRLPLSHIYSNDPEAIFYCAERILKVELVQFLVNSYEITSGVLRGLGYSLMPAVITLVGSCGLRLVWISTVFQKFRSYDSIIAVYPVSWTVTGIAMILAYAIIWKKISNSRLTAEK